MNKITEIAGLGNKGNSRNSSSERQGVDASTLGLNSKVTVIFMICRSDQKKKKERRNHTHTLKFKMASLNKTSGEGKHLVFPQM